MTDLIQEQLFQAQDRYDELEERLKGVPAFSVTSNSAF
jgi:hypothetical protein